MSGEKLVFNVPLSWLPIETQFMFFLLSHCNWWYLQVITIFNWQISGALFWYNKASNLDYFLIRLAKSWKVIIIIIIFANITLKRLMKPSELSSMYANQPACSTKVSKGEQICVPRWRGSVIVILISHAIGFSYITYANSWFEAASVESFISQTSLL